MFDSILAMPLANGVLLGFAYLFAELLFVWLVLLRTGFRRGRQFEENFRYFVVNHVAAVIVASLAAIPNAVAEYFFPWWGATGIDDLPFLVQLFLAFVTIEVLAYWIHFAFHNVRTLWRIHAVHHSLVDFDGIGSSRLHIAEAVLTRFPIALALGGLGLSPFSVVACLVFLSLHAIWIHSSDRADRPTISFFLVTPLYHYQHHTIGSSARYAASLALLDRLFDIRSVVRRHRHLDLAAAGNATSSPARSS